MLLTIKQVARELNVSLSLVYRLIAQGEIACYEVASCKRVDEVDLQDYLQRQRQQTLKPPRGQGRHF